MSIVIKDLEDVDKKEINISDLSSNEIEMIKLNGLMNIPLIKGEKGDTGEQGIQGIKGDKGEKGDKGDQGEQGIQGEKGEQGEQGIQGIQGIPGKDFSIYKTYSSIKEMNADKDNVEEGKFVIIASNVEDVDNSKLYVKGNTDFVYLTDMSGATGMKGEQGPQGIQGEQGIQGPKGEQGEVSTEQFNLLQSKIIKCLQEIETPTPVSGESIDIKDSAEARITELSINGNSEQETREGKENICRITGIFNTNANCIKATYNADRSMTFEKIADINAVHFGFVLNNTTTQNISLFMKYKVQTSNEVCTLYLRMDNGNFSNGADLDITGKCSEITWTGNSAGKNATAVSFTSTQLNVGDKITVYSIYAVLGDTFEPIVPSLDYRSEVKCCGDNVNLFNLDNYYNYANVNKCTKQLLSNGVILNFTAGDDAWIGNVYSVGTTITEIHRPACTKVKPNTTYTLKISSAPKCYMSFFDKDYKAVKNYIQIPSDNYIFTTDSSTYYIYLRLGYQDRTSGQTSYDFTDIKCVEGTEVGGYSKHGQGCITEVISNKNLCDFSKQQYSHIGLTSELNNNIWKISGTSTSTDYIFSFGRLSLGKLKAGTYNFSWKYNKYNISCGKNSLPLISLYNKNISQIYMNKRINTDDKYSKFTLTEDTEIWLGMWNDGTGNVYDIEIECQLELSEINTEIVSHKEQTYTIPTQQPLRSIGDIRDTFIKINNKWFERRYIERLILNGTETFDSWTGKAPSGYSVFYSKILTTVINSQRDLKCNALKYMENPWESGKNAIGLQRTFKELYISIKNTYANTLEDFKTYLTTQYNAGTPVYIDYVLQKPQDIECTEEQSKILDELSNATTYEKATHIYSADEISPVIDVTYKKNMEILFTNTLAESGV